MSSFPVSGRRKPWVRRAVFRLGLLAVLAAVFLGAKAEPPGTPLHDGLTLEREIRSGETHAYLVDLQAGQYLRVVLQEHGINLIAKLLRPDKTVVSGSDRLTDDTEDLAIVAEAPGLYRVAVTAFPNQRLPGRYHLRVAGPREAAAEDRSRAEAVRLFWEATHTPDGEGKDLGPNEIPAFEKVLSLWQSLGEPRPTAELLFLLGYARGDAGDTSRAAKEFRQAACLWKRLGTPRDREWQTKSLNNLARKLMWLGRWDEAKPPLEEALAVARDLDDPRLIQAVLNNLGSYYSGVGELRQAVTVFQQSVEYARKAKDPNGEARALSNLGSALSDLGESREALNRYKEALGITRDEGTRAAVLNNLGNLYDTLGDWERAAEHYRQALELNRRLKVRGWEAATLNNLGVVYERLGQPEEALRTYSNAIRIAEETKNDGLQGGDPHQPFDPLSQIGPSEGSRCGCP